MITVEASQNCPFFEVRLPAELASQLVWFQIPLKAVLSSDLGPYFAPFSGLTWRSHLPVRSRF